MPPNIEGCCCFVPTQTHDLHLGQLAFPYTLHAIMSIVRRVTDATSQAAIGLETAYHKIGILTANVKDTTP